MTEPLTGIDLPLQSIVSGRQPYLHDLVAAVCAPAVCLTGVDGQLRPEGVRGLYAFDKRVLSHLLVTVDGEEPTAIQGRPLGGPIATFTGIARSVGDPTPDPTVLVHRDREVTPEGMTERIRLVSTAQTHVVTELAIEVGTDLCPVEAIKIGATLDDPIGAEQAANGTLRWTDVEGTVVELSATPVAASVDVGRGTTALTWPVSLARGEELEVVLRVHVIDRNRGPAVFDAALAQPWSTPVVVADDRRLPALLSHSLADVSGLTLRDGDAPFVAAGVPWFLTLFGRDSIWAARMMLPLGTELALGTLTTLARRQGSVVDRSTEEEPGKILHEVRRGELVVDHVTLPPVYYGAVDATPLWICLLVDAWRWGARRSAIEELLDPALRALEWMRAHGDSDDDGFLEYVDHRGGGLANQGWKDSGDSIQWADGRLADPPLALCEVQAYAYEAAVGAADLLDAFGRPGGDRWREWAARLADAFRERFWVEDDEGPFPAVALDGAKKRIDSVASNMGHLLGTGLLNPAEEALVARRLASPDMDSGFGLRTLTAASPRFSVVSYHGGAVWPHDTAIAIYGLHRSGHDRVAASLLEGMLAAGAGFAFRLPELFGGEQRYGSRAPLPYPAACRPQAWAATSAVSILTAILGLRVDVPRGVITIAPMRPSPVGAVQVRGLQVAGELLDVDVAADGSVTVLAAPAGLEVRS